MEHRLGDDPQMMDPRSLEEGLANIGQKERKKRDHAYMGLVSWVDDEVHGHFKVPHPLRQVKETAYEPQLISIGPCHRHKEHLRDMEQIKMLYFSRLIYEKGNKKMDSCLEAISSMEEKVRNWYAAMSNIEEIARDWYAAMSKMVENVPISDWKRITRYKDEKAFPLMILVDGCFIIQLLCKELQDQFAKLRWSRLTLLGDLLLLENQLPFFVLLKLYDLIKDPEDTREFAPQAFTKFIEMLPGSTIGTINTSTIKNANEIDHLLGLVHDNWLPSSQGIELHKDYMGKRSRRSMERQSIRCARELEEAGIEFTKVDSNQESNAKTNQENNAKTNQESNAKTLFDVNFTDGKMEIPTFVIGDNTERLFRNLIAYELFVEGSTYVIDYVSLMDNLVNTANDVQLLRSRGVIENMLGDDQAVAQMLNKLRDNVSLSRDNFFYEEIFDNVKKHCDEPWNTFMAKLKHDYFRTPWTGIAFFAALLVFLTTIITFIRSFF